MEKKTLIISYTFPPSQGVGGRRWAKFSKYLNEKGRSVYLLTENLNIDASHMQYSDFEKVDFFKSGYPKILGTIPSSFMDKLHYRFALLYVKMLSKGNYYDRSAFLKKQFLKKAENIIRSHHIDEVIITGAPFRLLYFGTLLKQKFKIKLLSDIRDPWTWGEGYGMTLLSSKRKQQELYFEKEVLNQSDVITVPVEPMLNHLIATYTNESNKIKLLSHAYDSDDFSLELPAKKQNKINLIYGGTIYRELENEFEIIYKLCKENINLDFSIQFFTNRFQYLGIQKLEEIKESFSVSPYVAPGELMQKIKNADAYLLIFPDEVKDFLSTKFYEIICCRTPIIYVGNEGEVSRFITSNNLGIHIKPENLKKQLLELLSNKDVVNYNAQFPIEEYSFNSVTNTLLEYLK